MLISPEYIELNKKLHESRPDYGTSGTKWAPLIRALARQADCETILDYGCGKGTLRQELGDHVREYDPAIPGKDTPPEPADMVACTDVLEHIEPDCLDEVLADISRLMSKQAVLIPALVPAKKFLEDGRNAHLIVQPLNWWIDKIREVFDITDIASNDATAVIVVVPKGADTDA